MAQDQSKRPIEKKNRKGAKAEDTQGVHSAGAIPRPRPSYTHHSNMTTPKTAPNMVADPIHASFFSCAVAALTAAAPPVFTVKFVLRTCVGSICGVEDFLYSGLIGAPSYWYICSFCPRCASWVTAHACMRTVTLNCEMVLDLAAQGSWTCRRPSAAKGVATREPLSCSAYVPCWKRTMPVIHVGFEPVYVKSHQRLRTIPSVHW